MNINRHYGCLATIRNRLYAVAPVKAKSAAGNIELMSTADYIAECLERRRLAKRDMSFK